MADEKKKSTKYIKNTNIFTVKLICNNVNSKITADEKKKSKSDKVS